MKALTILLIAFFLLSLSGLYAQTYVNANATGNNDGSSWTDAYTDLSNAISNAALNEEIWVAAGTYVPSSPAGREATFGITKNVKLYGGFAGMETQLSERNPQANLSLLSGDVNGDDVVSNGSLLNRSDNVYHIMKINDMPDSTAIIDGFTFTGGHADGPAVDDMSGGAIHTQSDMLIRNCVFSKNFCTYLGGAVFADGGSGMGLRVTNCSFEKNRSNFSAGAMYISAVPQFLVDSCEFRENQCQPAQGLGRGGAIYASNSSGTFLSNLFSQNTAKSIAGGLGLVSTKNTGFSYRVSQCEFINNQSSSGGGMYISVNGDNDNILVDACEFSENLSVGSSNSSGGGIGLIHTANANPSGNSIRIEECLFKQNSSSGYGGGIELVNNDGQGNTLQIANCEFFENTADRTGGGISIYTPNDDNTFSLDQCHFKHNSSRGAMAVVIGKESGLGLSPTQECTISNCLFTDHIASDTLPVLRAEYARINIINVTIADNKGTGISVFGSGEITLQNNILFNPGYPAYRIARATNQANVSITSAGGNLVGDGTLNRWLGANDLSDTDPKFEVGTYQPAFYSPAVDLGFFYPGFLPTDIDLAGNTRWQGKNLDAGAYESPFTTSIKDLIVHDNSLTMYPVPVKSLATFELDNTWRGQVSMKVFNSLGQQVLQQNYSKQQNQVNWQIDFSHLAVGTYQLVVTDGIEAAVKSFVKK